MLTYGNRTADRGVDVRFTRTQARRGATTTVADFQGDGGYPASVQLADGHVVTAYYASKSSYHGRYHMGVAVWNPAQSDTE